jgi:hypothetical protein
MTAVFGWELFPSRYSPRNMCNSGETGFVFSRRPNGSKVNTWGCPSRESPDSSPSANWPGRRLGRWSPRVERRRDDYEHVVAKPIHRAADPLIVAAVVFEYRIAAGVAGDSIGVAARVSRSLRPMPTLRCMTDETHPRTPTPLLWCLRTANMARKTTIAGIPASASLDLSIWCRVWLAIMRSLFPASNLCEITVPPRIEKRRFPAPEDEPPPIHGFEGSGASGDSVIFALSM